jgi:transmembrane sensor
MDEKDIEKKMQEAWDAPVTEQPKANKEDLWQEFAAEAFPVRKRHYKKWLYPAAAAVLVLSLSITAFVYNNTSKANRVEMAYTIIENPSSEIKVITLPDSSVVEMEPDAVLRYGSHFSTNRNITLTGKAFFRVQKDKLHPFKVNCNQTITTVLGTCFTINSNNKNNVEVKLYEGRVQMNVKGNSSNWILAPGEKFTCNSDAIEVAAFNRFKDFNNSTLSQVCAYINKTYGYEIEIPEGYKNKKVTLRINEKENLRNVIDILAQMYDLKPTFNDKIKKITLQ